MLHCTYLLTLDSTKVLKSRKHGVVTAVLYLAPHRSSGRWNMCPWADGCQGPCLGTTSGKMIFPDARAARVERTRFFMEERGAFFAQLVDEVSAVRRRARALGMRAAVRLNGSSDVVWEDVFPDLFAMFPDVRFYDYTKARGRMDAYLAGKLPSNYSLTYSMGGSLESQMASVDFLEADGSVAVVFKGALPDRWMGAPVVDGDVTDFRPDDPPGSVVGLRAKGAARFGEWSFVHDPEPEPAVFPILV